MKNSEQRLSAGALEEEWGGMSEVLEKWEIAKISDFAKTTSGGTPSRKNPGYYTGDIPWIKSGDLNDGNVSEATEFITEEALKGSSAKLFPAGTLMIALYGATIGKLGVLTIEAATNQAICGIFVPEEVETKYLFYFLLFHRQELVKQGAGGAQPNISQGIIRDVEVPLPPLPEQRRIVARIEKLFSRLDAGVAALRHAKAQLKRYRQSVLAAAVTGELTKEWREQHPDVEPAEELLERILEKRRSGKDKYKEPVPPNDAFGRMPPSSWQMASMDALTCHVTSGSRDWKKYYEDDGYAVFVMAQNVRPLRFISKPVIRVSPPEGNRDKVRSAVAANDILITIVGANTGDVCRVDQHFEDYYVCQSVALLRPVEAATAKYLELYMNSEEHGQDQFDKWMYGQGRPHLSFDQLRSTAVFLPPLAEQHQIVAEVEARTTAIDHLEAELDRQITRSNRLRQSTLSTAFHGTLV